MKSVDCEAKELLSSGKVDEAVKVWERAAKAGDAHAMFKLGQLYFRGKNVPADYNRALDWLYSADKKNYPGAPFYIGLICKCNGDQDYAMEWFMRGAKHGDHAALARIGYCYSNGWGVSKSRKRAFEYFTKAKEAGNFAAHVQYVKFLAKGHNGLRGFFLAGPEFFRVIVAVLRYAFTDSPTCDDDMIDKFAS